MNCANHADVPATAYCRTCGKPLCPTCARDVRGVIYCEECLASHLSGTLPPAAGVMPPAATPPQSGAGNPTLAAILGCIPGVGAIYNGEYAKGFLHVVIFATLIWMSDHVSGLFGLGVAAFVVYMPIEAYKTAQARRLGVPPPDPLGLNQLFSSAPAVPVVPPNVPPADGVAPGTVVEGQPPEVVPPTRVPIGAVILIGLGVLFLLDELNVLHFDRIWQFWPLVLIAIGVRVLMRRRGMGY